MYVKQLNAPIVNADSLFAAFNDKEGAVGRILYSWSQDYNEKKISDDDVDRDKHVICETGALIQHPRLVMMQHFSTIPLPPLPHFIFVNLIKIHFYLYLCVELPLHFTHCVCFAKCIISTLLEIHLILSTYSTAVLYPSVGGFCQLFVSLHPMCNPFL